MSNENSAGYVLVPVELLEEILLVSNDKRVSDWIRIILYPHAKNDKAQVFQIPVGGAGVSGSKK